jgi:hypothetical protein
MWSRLTFGLLLLGAGRAANAAPPDLLTFPSEIRLLGASHAFLERAYGRLCAPPLDDPEFVLSDVGFQLTRRFTEYSGDISGRMLGALNAAEALLGRESEMTKALCARFPQYQKADGHFGTDQDLKAQVDQARDMPILWGNGRLLLALSERCRRAPDPALRTAAERLGEYVLSTRPYYGLKENFERVGGQFASGFTTCYPSMIDGLVALAELTGEARFADEARFIAKLSLLDKEFKQHHSHGRLVAYRGMLDLDRLSGRAEFTSEVAAGCRRVTEEMILPTGGVTEMSDREYVRDEGCSEADWLRVNLLLWRATGETVYLDAAEHVLRNHLLVMQYSNGGFGHCTFNPLVKDGQTWPAGRVEHFCSDSYWCCSMHGAQVLTDAAEYAAVAAGNAICLTWLAETQSTFDIAGKKVSVRTEQVQPTTWRVTTGGAGESGVTLRLRAPGWSDSVLVNGVPNQAAQGWVEYPIKASDSSTITVEFSRGIRLAGPYAAAAREGEPRRVFAGPDLYCLTQPLLDRDFLPEDGVPVIYLAAEMPSEDTGRIPVLAEGREGRLQKALLEPLLGRTPGACWFLFDVRRVTPEDFAAKAPAALPPRALGPRIECLFASDQAYEVYLNGEKIFSGAGWSESPRVTAYAVPGVNTIAVITPAGIKVPGLIGMVLTGQETLVTQPGEWSAYAFGDTPPPALLTQSSVEGEALPLNDLGGFGAAPWKHTPAHYASTPARWIWPQDNTTGEGRTHFLFRRTFDL